MIDIKVLLFLSACFSSSFSQNESCGFDYKLLIEQQSGDYGAIQTEKLSTNWKDNKIPYYFDRNVLRKDKKNIQRQMGEVKKNSCIRFREIGQHELKQTPHRLIIVVNNNNQKLVCVGGVYSGRSQQQEVRLTVSRSGCTGGLILHELGHVLGLAHTIKRPDRDDFVQINDGCIEDRWKRQYYKISENEVNYYGVPYMCNSIMHYT